ncbi:MAG TPA: tetratricopeptide repeat protein, partial [Candidatus Saccharimonadia bacterium]|nr:tetratricopeptide repeat protein [Candidatus Saccharimonadia bacterium]
MSAAPNPSVPPQAPVTAAPSAAEQFLEKNFKKIAIGFGLLVVVVVALGLARHFRHQTELEASERFTAAKNVEDCDLIINKYPGTQSAGNALLLKADFLWGENKKESSVKTLQEFLKSESDHPLAPQATLALGSKQVAMGEKDSGRKTLEEVVQKFPKTDVAAAAQLQIGDLLWADGKIDEARKIFLELPRNYPGSPILPSVEERSKMIDSGLPTVEVDPPPAPPAPPVPAPGAAVPSIPSLLNPTAPAPLSVPSLKGPMAPSADPLLPAPPTVPVVPAPAPTTPEAPKTAPAPAPATPAADKPAPAPAP